MIRLLAFSLLLPFLTHGQQTVTIPMAPFDRLDVPIYISLKNPGGKDYGLLNKTNGHVYPIQWQGDTAVFIPTDLIPANKETQFSISQLKKKPDPVHFESTGSQVIVRKGKLPVFVYNIREVMPPADSLYCIKDRGLSIHCIHLRVR